MMKKITNVLLLVLIANFAVAQYSAVDSVIVGLGGGGSTNWGRGFRFTPTQDLFVFQMGKRVPGAATFHWVIWDFNSQTQVYKQRSNVDVPGQYVYENTDSIVKLTGGTDYILMLYTVGTPGYYFGSSTQVGPYITYGGEARYCNSCDTTVFPTGTVPNFHYGTPDFIYSICDDSLSSQFDITILQGQNYMFGGNSLTSTGIYMDTLASSMGCDSVITLNLTVNPNGVGKSYFRTEKVVLFPNPVTEQLNLSIKDADLRLTKLEIVDIQGRVKYIKNNNFLSNESVPVKDLNGGIYFVKLYFDNGENTILKFTKY